MTNDYGNLEVQPLVSVIIPVYKVEEYLKECVDSVRNQTYSNLEIILVDDGSPDRCGQMCDEFASEDDRIQVIHQANSGVAKARNAGLCCLSGDYVFFVDSDDVVLEDTIEIMVKTAKIFDADMICSDCRSIDEEGQFLEGPEPEQEPVCMTCDEALRYYAPKEWAPWNRLVKSVIHKQIFFPAYGIHEDEAIKFQLLERCRCVIELRAQTYLYRQRKSSITGSASKVDRIDMFYSRRENLDFLKRNHPDIVELFLPKVCEDALFNLGCLIRQERSVKIKERITEIVAFAKENYKLIRCSNHMSLAQKVRFSLLVLSDWRKEKCLYSRFYLLLDRIRGR